MQLVLYQPVQFGLLEHLHQEHTLLLSVKSGRYRRVLGVRLPFMIDDTELAQAGELPGEGRRRALEQR